MPGLTATRPGVDNHTPLILLPRTKPARPGAPRVLLLHGMANNGNVWQPLCEETGDRWEIWSAELPWRNEGVGSWAHEEDSARWVAEALTGVTDSAGPIDLVVAHSFAASLLLRVLAEVPAPSPRAAVLVSPFFKPSPDDFDWAMLTGLATTFVDAMREGIRVAAAGRGNPELHDAAALRVCERIGPYAWTRFLQTYLNSPWVDLDRVDLPCLVLAGEDDLIAPPGDATSLAGRLPSARLELLPSCGHFPMAQEAGAFTGKVADFLATLPPLPVTPNP